MAFKGKCKCYESAAEDEPIFVLRAHDASFAHTVLAWINNRIETGKNKNDDPEIQEAFDCINQAANWREAREQDRLRPPNAQRQPH